ncbi:MAG: lysophospholipid acyltransferase family protein, partial [Nitrospinae bacterium]|nr:lysophospholipid acyltransferase family protein [Nitrospinota bacterium]
MEIYRIKRMNLRSLRYKVEYIIFLIFSYIIPTLPRRGAIFIGKILGRAGYYILSQRNKIALINLNMVFKDSKSLIEKKRIIKNSFKNLAVGFLDLLWFNRGREKNIKEIIETDREGIELVRKAFDRGRGVLFLISHFGNWEIMAIYHGYLNFTPLNSIVVRRLDNPYLDKWINHHRCISGNKIIYKHNASKEILKALRRNEGVAISFDQNTAKGGIFVNLFGLPAATTRSIATFALITGAPIIPATCYPLEGGRYKIVYGPEIVFNGSGNRKRDIHTLTQICNDFIE